MPELTGSVRGEKEWQGWAQDHVDWLDERTGVTQDRLPYFSTLSQKMSDEEGIAAVNKILGPDAMSPDEEPVKVEYDLA
jgi:hypothetical protein